MPVEPQSAIYSQVFQSPSRAKKSAASCTTERTILIDVDNSANISSKQQTGSKKSTNRPSKHANETFTSKLPPVPRRNSKNTLTQNSNSNLNLLSASATNASLSQQQVLAQSKLYQKI